MVPVTYTASKYTEPTMTVEEFCTFLLSNYPKNSPVLYTYEAGITAVTPKTVALDRDICAGPVVMLDAEEYGYGPNI